MDTDCLLTNSLDQNIQGEQEDVNYDRRLITQWSDTKMIGAQFHGILTENVLDRLCRGCYRQVSKRQLPIRSFRRIQAIGQRAGTRQIRPGGIPRDQGHAIQTISNPDSHERCLFSPMYENPPCPPLERGKRKPRFGIRGELDGFGRNLSFRGRYFRRMIIYYLSESGRR